MSGLMFSAVIDEKFGVSLPGLCHNLGKSSLPIRNLALSLAFTAPEEIIGVCDVARGDASQFLGHAL
jgi:hypothetical protein